MRKSHGVIPGWCEGDKIKGDFAPSTRPRISRFRVRCFASPRNDCGERMVLPPPLRQKSNFPFPFKLMLLVQPSRKKYFASRLAQITFISAAVPRPPRGTFRDRHERWVRDAVDAIGTSDECADRGRRSRVVPTPRRWRQALRDDPQSHGGKKARSPRRARRKPLKPFACGNAGLKRRTCGDYARVVFIFPTRGCGCGCASGIPHALFGRTR